MAAVVGERTAVVTGGGSGLGLAVAHRLAHNGFRLVLVVRDRTRGDAARSRLIDDGAPSVDLAVGDLSSLEDVRAVGAELTGVDRIDVLVHNAGLWPSTRELGPDGLERAFVVNHLAPYLLDHLLESRLAASATRVVQVTAGLYPMGRPDLERTPTGDDFHPIRTYATTKLCNLMLVPEFARRWSDLGVTINAVHPGVLRTGLARRPGITGAALMAVKRVLFRPVDRGVEPVVRPAIEPDQADLTGRYFHLEREKPLRDPATDQELAARLWDQAASLTGVPADAA